MRHRVDHAGLWLDRGCAAGQLRLAGRDIAARCIGHDWLIQGHDRRLEHRLHGAGLADRVRAGALQNDDDRRPALDVDGDLLQAKQVVLPPHQ